MLVGVMVLCIIGFVVSHANAQEMTEEQIRKLFPMAGTTVPEFDIVHIHPSHIQKRDVYGQRSLTLKAFDQNIKLWLKPIDGMLATAATPVWTVRQGYHLKLQPKILQRIVDKLLEDEKHAASIILDTHDDGKVDVNGYIGSNNVHIYQASDDDVYTMTTVFKRSVDNVLDRCENCTTHIVYKVPESSRHLQMRGVNTLKHPIIKSSKSKRSVPSVIYPEIMVIVDYAMYAQWNNNLYQALRYLLAFWNSVDMRYRPLENPSYRLNIAGIIIAEEPKALHFMNYYKTPEGRDIDVYKSLEEFRRYSVKLETVIGFKSDVLITMTSDVFCTVRLKEGSCTRDVAGLAFRGGACTVPKPIESNDFRPAHLEYGTSKVGVVHDNTGFDGINVAAHELGHLLGANHDGVFNYACSHLEGNLMTPAVSLKPKSTEWSLCTLKDFQEFLGTSTAQCLFNKPRSYGGEELTRFLAGQLMSADEQCAKYFGQGAKAYPEGSTCTKLSCRTPPYGFFLDGPVADGTVCGKGKICLHGQCIKDIRHIKY